MNELATKEVGGEFLLYQTEDGQVKLEVRLQNKTDWLTQQMMAELFRTSKQNISHHINGIYEEGELQPVATVKKYLTVRREGNRDVRRELDSGHDYFGGLPGEKPRAHPFPPHLRSLALPMIVLRPTPYRDCAPGRH